MTTRAYVLQERVRAYYRDQHRDERNRLARVDPKAWERWKEFPLATCTDPAVAATSEHFLVVAQRR